MRITPAKTVVITGASSGLGLGVAEAYLQRGDNVVLNARNETRLAEVAERLGHADRVAVVAGDIGEPETRRRLIETAVDRFGAVDVLVNSAGHFYPKPFADYTEADLDGFLAVHLKGSFFTAQEAVRHMRSNGGGAQRSISTAAGSQWREAENSVAYSIDSRSRSGRVASRPPCRKLRAASSTSTTVRTSALLRRIRSATTPPASTTNVLTGPHPMVLTCGSMRNEASIAAASTDPASARGSHLAAAAQR